LHQIQKLLHGKGHNPQREETAHRMGENLPDIHLTGDSYLEYIKNSQNESHQGNANHHACDPSYLGG
jgi:hypothetical protein